MKNKKKFQFLSVLMLDNQRHFLFLAIVFDDVGQILDGSLKFALLDEFVKILS